MPMLMREASARLGECDRTFCETEALLVRRHSGCALVRPSVSHGVHSPHVRGFRPVAVGGRRRLGNAATGFRVHSDQHAGRVLAKKRSPRVWAEWWVLVPRLSRSERVRRVLQPGYRAMASPAGYECRAPRLVHGSMRRWACMCLPWAAATAPLSVYHAGTCEPSTRQWRAARTSASRDTHV
jgi:hypothetical protein